MAILVAAFLPVAKGAEKIPDKKERHGLEEIARLQKQIADTSNPSERRELIWQLSEVKAAVNNDHRKPVPAYVDFIEFPILFFDALYNPIGKGRTRATNLASSPRAEDLSRLDPIGTTFWKRPSSISAANLATGFGRNERPAYDGVWTYAAPKKSGRNPGCALEKDGQRIKIKFAEIHSEPFASRIFDALGYNVDPTDYSPALKLKYDRRFFAEFNSRRPMTMSAGVFFIPFYHLNLQAHYNPFRYIDHAVLQTGESITGDELETRLTGNSTANPKWPGFVCIDPAFEEQIAYLVTKPANVQIETPHSHNIGPWDFGHGHEKLRELRGAGLLAAWLGWWDSRFENTRVRIVKTSEGRALKHYFTDLGGGLGKAGGTFKHSCENTNDFASSFTKSTISYGHLRFQIVNFEPVEHTPAFAEMTIDDARWMARLIGQLTEQQITDALAASGFNADEVRLYTEKLIARRDKMISDLQLSNEIALLRPAHMPITASSSQPKFLSKSH